MKLFDRRYLALWVALLTFLLTQLCSHYPSITEYVYAQRIYPIISVLLSFLFRFIPFSFSDLFYVFLLLFIGTTLTLLLVRRIEFKKAFYIIMTSLAITYTLFYWFWGFNYFRQSFENRMALKPIPINKELFYKCLYLQLEATNRSYTPAFKLTKYKVDSLLEISYHQLGPKLGLTRQIRYPVTKNMTFSRFFAGNSISGYFSPFANEVHVNTYLLPVQYPMILAHEKAHQLGITSEAEASFYGWQACLESKNNELVYSANLFILMQFNKQEKSLFDSTDIKTLLLPEVAADYNKVKEYWKNLKFDKIEKVSSFLYDHYLKANQVTGGIQDYQGVVPLIITFQNQNTMDTLENYSR
jgi:hypothetical protein